MSAPDVQDTASLGGTARGAGRGRRLVGLAGLVLGLFAVLFVISPLSPHSTTGVVVAPAGEGYPIRVQVDDRGGPRTATMGVGEDQDLAVQSVGARLPVLTYPSGGVFYDDGQLRLTLWALSALLTVAGGLLLLAGRRADRQARLRCRSGGRL